MMTLYLPSFTWKSIKDILEHDGCMICDVNISPDQRITPKLKVGKQLEEI